MFLHREVSKPTLWVHRKFVVQGSQFDRSDIAIISTRDRMIFVVASDRIPNHVFPLAETTMGARVQWRKYLSIKLTFLTVPDTMFLGLIGCDCEQQHFFRCDRMLRSR